MGRISKLILVISAVCGVMFGLLLSSNVIFAQSRGNPNQGAIWTTRSSCGEDPQDENHYSTGEVVYINGSGFEPNTTLPWSIISNDNRGQCGHIKGTVVAASDPQIITDSNGNFCVPAYTIAPQDCGEYTVDVDRKNDNYQINSVVATPTPTPLPTSTPTDTPVPTQTPDPTPTPVASADPTPTPDPGNSTGGGQILAVAASTTSTVSGQVLGASTLANTGESIDNIFTLSFAVGAFLTALGVRIYGQKTH